MLLNGSIKLILPEACKLKGIRNKNTQRLEFIIVLGLQRYKEPTAIKE